MPPLMPLATTGYNRLQHAASLLMGTVKIPQPGMESGNVQCLHNLPGAEQT